MKPKLALDIGKGTVKEFNDNKVLRLSAALAYYAIFSLGPLLLVIITVLGWVLGDEAVRGQVQESIKGIVGEGSAKTIESMIAAKKMGSSPITTALAIITLLMGASGVFGQLQDALNTIFEVKAKPGMGIMSFLRARFLSLSMVLGLGFLLLISMVITTGVEALVTKGGNLLPIPPFVTSALSVILSFSVVALMFAMIFKYLPDVKLRWKDVWIGALVTAALFTLGKFLLSLYLGREGTSSSYGAAGSVIVILLWIYYSSVILFFGAEFTKVCALKTGWQLKTSKYAVPVTEEAKAQEGMPRPDIPPGREVPAPVFAKKLTPSSAALLTGVPEFAGKPGAIGGVKTGGATQANVPAGGAVVRLHPWASVVAALGIGIVTGWQITKDLTGRPAAKARP